MGEEAKESGELAGEAKPLDAEAAQDLAMPSTRPSRPRATPAAPGEMQAAQNGVRQDLAQASAELAARQQQIAAEAAQAQAEAQGNHEAGTRARSRTGPQQGRARCPWLRHRSSQGAKKMGPGGAASPDGKAARRAGPPQGALVRQFAPRGPRHHAQQCPTPPPPGYERRTQEYFENLDR